MRTGFPSNSTSSSFWQCLTSDLEAELKQSFLTCRQWLWVQWSFFFPFSFIRRCLSKQLTKLSREHFGLLVSQWKMGRHPSEADMRQSEGGTTSCSLHTHTRTQIWLHSQHVHDYGHIFREPPAFFKIQYIFVLLFLLTKQNQTAIREHKVTAFKEKTEQKTEPRNHEY